MCCISIRRGNQQKWIWIIVFLPLIGSSSSLYIYRNCEAPSCFRFAKQSNHSGKSKGRISDLENNSSSAPHLQTGLHWPMPIENGMIERAIELYEQSLEGVFKDNEHVIKQLIHAYYSVNRFEDIVKIAPKWETEWISQKRKPICFTPLLLKNRRSGSARKEFKGHEPPLHQLRGTLPLRWFLLRQNRRRSRPLIFTISWKKAKTWAVVKKGDGAIWINKAGEEWRKIMQQ